MRKLDKDKLLAGAEVADAWRVVPRLLLLGYCWFVYELTYYLLDWYTALPGDERGLEATGLAAGVFTAATGLATKFVSIYINTGRRWGRHDPGSGSDSG